MIADGSLPEAQQIKVLSGVPLPAVWRTTACSFLEKLVIFLAETDGSDLEIPSTPRLKTKTVPEESSLVPGPFSHSAPHKPTFDLVNRVHTVPFPGLPVPTGASPPRKARVVRPPMPQTS
jgi:hypothetical protein